MDIWILVACWIGVFTVTSIALNRWFTLERGLDDCLTLQGPITLIHSDRGLDLIDRLANATRAWKVWGPLGVAVSLVGMVFGAALMGLTALRVMQNPSNATLSQPRNYLVVPGVNDFLPAAAAPEIVLSLLIAMVVHEFGHAIFCRTADINIKSTGLALFALIPMGAFVEPDEESQGQKSYWAQMQMVSAGIMNNVAVLVLTVALLASPLVGLITVAPGASVDGAFPRSPADAAGIDSGDRITAVGETPVETNANLQAALNATNETNISVTVNGERTATVERRVFVTGVAEASPNVSTGARIKRVDGVRVNTTDEYTSALAASEDTQVTLALDSGETVRLTRGALVVPQENSSLVDHDAISVGDPLTITEFNGRDTPTEDALSTAINDAEPGETSEVVALVNGTRETATVTLTEGADGTAHLGVTVTPGVQGMTVADFGVSLFPAEHYLNLFHGEGLSLVQHLVVLLSLPFGTLIGLSHNFAGFTPSVTNFYDVAGVAGGGESAVFFLVSTVFWMAWLNLNLALFNALPTYALDGGHLARLVVKESFAKLSRDPESLAAVSVVFLVKAAMLAALLSILVLPLV